MTPEALYAVCEEIAGMEQANGPVFPTGNGQSDTHRLAGLPYATIGGKKIVDLVRDPQPGIPKDKARWFIPSTYVGHDAREHKVQRERGEFWWLCGDIDKGNPPLADVNAALKAVVGECTVVAYSTRSATADCRKWRVLVPLAGPLPGADYTDTQGAFFDLLETEGLVVDRALGRPAQLIYLPNRGEHYEYGAHKGPHLDLTTDHPIVQRREAVRAERAEAQNAAADEHERKAAARRAADDDTGSLIEHFNGRHSLTELMALYGYTQAGGTADWHSPLQSSGSFATRVDGERWISLSGSDAAAGLGHETPTGARAGDSFDLFCHFEHGGNQADALRAGAEETAASGHRGSNGAGKAEHPRERGPHTDDGGPRRSAFYSAASLKGKPVPPREWLVDELVPMRTVTLFSGDGGTGKSLLALQLAAAVAAGGTWLGRPVRQGRVIYLSAEDDDDELHRRLADVLRATGAMYDDLAGLTLRSLAGEDALLAVETQFALMRTELFDNLEAQAADEGPVLIGIDTQADVFPANENDRAKVRQFIGILRGLSLRQRCAVMLLGHPSLTGLSSGTGMSGSTAWNNSVRSRLYLERIKLEDGYEADPDKRIMSTKKSNFGRIGGSIGMTWRDGVFFADEAETSRDRMAAGAKVERVFLKLLDAFAEQGRYVSATPSTTYAPSTFAKHPEAESCTKRALAAAMEALFHRGTLTIAQHGKGVNARSHIARAGQ